MSTMFPSFEPNNLPYYYPLSDQTCEYNFEDIFDTYHSLTGQTSYQDSNHSDYAAHFSTSEENPVFQEMITGNAIIKDHNLDFTASSFSKDEQNQAMQEKITVASSSKSSHNTFIGSFMPQPNNFHIDVGMREKVHAGLKFALRMKTKLEVVDDGFKWRKYGKKVVIGSPYPRNYFKCSVVGCNVKKRIQRDVKDSRYVITTYDGVHNHKGS